MEAVLPHDRQAGKAIPRRAPAAAGRGVSPLVISMVLVILGVAALAFWDDERESSAALDDFAEEQVSVARAVAVALSASLATAKDDSPEAALVGVQRLQNVERRGALLLLFQPPSGGLIASDGGAVRSDAIEAAIARGAGSLRLSRPEAAALGLPARMAMAGLVGFDAGRFGRWGVAVVATAQRGRDRELRAKWRLLLGVGVASGLVLVFGGLALRKQRRQLELARELAIAEIEQARDERLVRADKLATMGALATGIAHEVSTPLGVIVGRAEQLAPRLDSDERGRRAVASILEQSERISRIIRGFLSLARGDAPSMEHVAPALVAEKAIELVEHRFTKAGVRLESEVEPGLAMIACEPRLFEQALVNLLLNACDACDPGGHVELRVRAESGRVAFVVTDDGTGIADDVALRATEPFFTTKPAGRGTGLGLAITNEIVKHHQGKLSLVSRTETNTRGTRACIELPVAEGALRPR